LVGYFNKQSVQRECSPTINTTARVVEPTMANLSEQAQDDPMIALQRARALIATSVCNDFSHFDGWMTT